MRPVAWKTLLKKDPPASENTLLAKKILRAAALDLLKAWNGKNRYPEKGGYFVFGGTDEAHIRPAAAEAFALAVAAKTAALGSAADEARAADVSARLAASLARAHRANTAGGWGNAWQSAQWTAYAGGAGWLVWEKLPKEARADVAKMVEYEANRFNKLKPAYYRGANGKIIYAGDSKAEENAWNGQVLALASAMMPKHPNKRIWHSRMLENMISSFSRPQDVGSAEKVQGQPLSFWLKGSNAETSGVVRNHGIVHPDYMATFSFNFFGGMMLTLAGEAIPDAARFNADAVYAALTKPVLKTGAIYSPDGSIRYPAPSRWGTGRRAHFALADMLISLFGRDAATRKAASGWYKLHAGTIAAAQEKNGGKAYASAAEDMYAGRDQWVVEQAAEAYLARFLYDRRGFTIHAGEYPLKFLAR